MQWSLVQGETRVRGVLSRARAEHRDVLEQFGEWLREERCLAPLSIGLRLWCGRDFLEAVAKGEVEATLGRLDAAAVESFFVEYAAGRAVGTRRSMATGLRSLLRFAALRGWVHSDLVSSVPPVFSYRLSTVPAGISDANVDRVLGYLKPDSARNCRDRAILLLLATYGVRNGQISDLRLGDLAWSARRVRFCAQKRGRSVRHPLTPAVAEGLALYLREHRAKVEHDHVFTRRRRPLSPLSPGAIRHIVVRRLVEAGVEGPKAPRAFRHALACRLLSARQPLKLIADTFGHQSLRATAVYAKADHSYLEEAATEWQELAP